MNQAEHLGNRSGYVFLSQSEPLRSFLPTVSLHLWQFINASISMARITTNRINVSGTIAILKKA